MLSNLGLIYLQQNTHGGNSGLEEVLLSTANVINNQEMGVFSDFFLEPTGLFTGFRRVLQELWLLDEKLMVIKAVMYH